VHANLFRYLGGVPKFVVCDNLKAAVTNPDRYDPGINRTYAEMAAHYGTAILAARPRRPKDKAKVEVAVQIAQRWILARLRNQRFFSLAELNAAIGVLVVELNARQMRGFGSSRAELFAEIDRLKLGELPDQPYVFARWKRCRVAPDYHVEIDGHLSLARSYDKARVDAACRRGILIKARSVASIRSILKNGLDRAFLDERFDDQPLRHGNIRGQGYFH